MRGTRASAATATLLIVAIVADSSFAADRPQFGPIDASQVLNAIDRGVAYLKREQSARGRWNEMVGYDGGVTALCTLSLLNSGVPVDDPRSSRSLTYLRSMEPDKTYVVALQTMVLCAAEPKKDMVIDRAERSLARIASNQRSRSRRRLVVSRTGRRQQQFAIRGARTLRCSMCRSHRESPHLATRRRLLAQNSKRRRLLGLCAGRGRFGQHDLRRHRRPRDLHCRARVGRRGRRKWPRRSAADRISQTMLSTAPSTGLRNTFR